MALNAHMQTVQAVPCSAYKRDADGRSMCVLLVKAFYNVTV
jgi:hypothetical protein